LTETAVIILYVGEVAVPAETVTLVEPLIPPTSPEEIEGRENDKVNPNDKTR